MDDAAHDQSAHHHDGVEDHTPPLQLHLQGLGHELVEAVRGACAVAGGLIAAKADAQSQRAGDDQNDAGDHRGSGADESDDPGLHHGAEGAQREGVQDRGNTDALPVHDQDDDEAEDVEYVHGHAKVAMHEGQHLAESLYKRCDRVRTQIGQNKRFGAVGSDEDADHNDNAADDDTSQSVFAFTHVRMPPSFLRCLKHMVLLKLRVVCAGCPFSEPPAALNNGLAVQQDAEMCFVVRPNIGKERGCAAGGVEP